MANLADHKKLPVVVSVAGGRTGDHEFDWTDDRGDAIARTAPGVAGCPAWSTM